MKKIVIIAISLVFLSALFCMRYITLTIDNKGEETNQNDDKNNNIRQDDYEEQEEKEMKQKEVNIDDWRIMLVNYENPLPQDYKIELVNIDTTRQFDKRAIDELLTMMKNMKKSGITNIWAQSTYRSIELQQKLFDEKVKEYKAQGKTKEEAEQLTLKLINKPATSEHNLGLAVDFNYVNYTFESTSAFKWLNENAEDYGFILRYRKDKEEITKVSYEPWHWRYVGVEHAKKINELDMCLEEYIDYLKFNNY